MKKKKWPKWPLERLEEVTWVDSMTGSGWSSIENYQRMETALCRTVGYVAKDSRKELVLVQSQGAETKRTSSQATGSMTIPKSVITSRRKIDGNR